MKWISINERLPDLEERYSGGPKDFHCLIFTGHYVTAGRLEETYTRRKLSWKDARGRCVNVTHWMPFPNPPSSDGGAA